MTAGTFMDERFIVFPFRTPTFDVDLPVKYFLALEVPTIKAKRPYEPSPDASSARNFRVRERSAENLWMDRRARFEQTCAVLAFVLS